VGDWNTFGPIGTAYVFESIDPNRSLQQVLEGGLTTEWPFCDASVAIIDGTIAVGAD
jgi:hypothetical protein